MIIRRGETNEVFIRQPDHAALARTIMEAWTSEHFPESARKKDVLLAVEHHDSGWHGVDASLVVEGGRVLDFVELSGALKQSTSIEGVARLAQAPYAAALVCQHRLHVYKAFKDDPTWAATGERLRELQRRFLHVAGAECAAHLHEDYAFVRAGDLASLTFCLRKPLSDEAATRYAMSIEGDTLMISPDPLAGRTLVIELPARELPRREYRDAAEARAAWAAAPVVTIRGQVAGR